MACWYEWRGSQLLLKLKVRARGNRNSVTGVLGDRLRISVQAPPVDGKANAALLRYLAAEFQVPTNNVCMVHGASAPLKTVTIDQVLELPNWFHALNAAGTTS